MLHHASALLWIVLVGIMSIEAGPSARPALKAGPSARLALKAGPSARPALKTKPDREMFPARPTVLEINAANGETWGKWREEAYCEAGTWAIGFELKVEPPQGITGDDTALNAIRLTCADKNGMEGGKVTSGIGEFGFWTGEKRCMKVKDMQFFITGFKLKVQASSLPIPIVKDETAANNIIVQCRGFDSENYPENVYPIEGEGAEWGKYGDFSNPCNPGSAVCGLKTRIHPYQGLILDDTALNDIIFYCCKT